MKPMCVKLAFRATTAITLSCAGGGDIAAHAKLDRPANHATAIGVIQRRTQGVAGGPDDSGKTHKRSSMVTASSRTPLAVEKKHKSRFSRRRAAHLQGHARFGSAETLSKREIAMTGLASFYSEDHDTASGESFNKHQLNAAHPSFPFGTRLRVTNVLNGRFVTVRVNDRGPFVHGRIIDVTSAAAEALGMIDTGVVKVTLDIVR